MAYLYFPHRVDSCPQGPHPKIAQAMIGVSPDSSLAAAVAMAPFDSGFDPRQRRHLIRA